MDFASPDFLKESNSVASSPIPIPSPKITTLKALNEIVPVYILTANVESAACNTLQQLFQSPIFDIQVANIAVPVNYSVGTLERRKSEELYRFLWVLKHAQKKGSSHFIVLKDTCVTNSDARSVEDVINTAIQSQPFDLCYLSNWLDRCDLYNNVTQLGTKGTFIAQSHSPHGFQALLISRNGAELLLGKKSTSSGDVIDFTAPAAQEMHQRIVNKELKAISVWPNLFDYNILLAERSSDYLKGVPCVTAEQTDLQNTIHCPNAEQTQQDINFFQRLTGAYDAITTTNKTGPNLSTKIPNPSSNPSVPATPSGTRPFWWLVLLLIILFIFCLIICCCCWARRY